MFHPLSDVQFLSLPSRCPSFRKLVTSPITDFPPLPGIHVQTHKVPPLLPYNPFPPFEYDGSPPRPPTWRPKSRSLKLHILSITKDLVCFLFQKVLFSSYFRGSALLADSLKLISFWLGVGLRWRKGHLLLVMHLPWAQDHVSNALLGFSSDPRPRGCLCSAASPFHANMYSWMNPG